ncbi:virulence factor BrkB family protein [Enterovibrio makurazakiensis]|uniref:UPF0761 membrane protein LRP50_23980 n=1 Tax=Enterovibrio gelatinilyticus TaxID=2899819 RepID=A0ABT5R7F4_9GAMM|nr:virulence factor BrkB family protein [Enterovibrio sp. ZSDZ42]MDD1796186.1 virulence factor BrkB family protein [Enterovibrio sp. ZSDZ42]
MVEGMERLKHLMPRIGQILFAFLRHLVRRIVHDRLTVSAGYMAYVTLLSLVPLITVVLSALSIFPSFAEAGDEIRTFVLHNFVPASSDALEQYLNQFVANAGKMTAVGVAFLFVVALMLISAIDKSLNYIWRVKHKRASVVSFSIYWMVLTLGPVLVGSSIGVSSYLGSLNLLDLEGSEMWAPTLLRGLPFILTTLAFWGLYTLVPNCRIRVSHALIGAMSASVLFEFSKKGFAFYATNFPSYELIYGALAVVPLLFVWVYLSWCIVLLGAEITASLGERSMWFVEAEPEKDQITDS